jgi:hypothetical protein
MWLYKKEILSESECCNLNFLYNKDKFFIMDNHLAAAWCWQQKIFANRKYNLFHIDRHYDLLDNVGDQIIEQYRDKLSGSLIEDYINLKLENNPSPLLRFDNYLQVFRRLYPKLIKSYYFATHDDGDYLDTIKSYKPEIWDLQENISYWISKENEFQWILNLDLDYFFTDRKEINYQFLTDEYINAICIEIENSISKIDVITIALSPEFCNGWNSAFRIMDIISNYFHLDFKYE